MRLAWVDLLVAGNAVRVDDVLEAAGELVETVVGWRCRGGVQAVEDRSDVGTAHFLNFEFSNGKPDGFSRILLAGYL